MRHAIPSVLLSVCVLLSVAWRPAVRPQANVEPPAKVSGAAWNAAAAAAGAGADVIVTAQGYPDLSLARTLTTKEAKTRFVVDTLTRYADVSQASLRRDLAFRQLPYRVLWLTNSVAVPAASQTTLIWLAARTDVRRIDLDMKGRGIETAQPAFTNLAAVQNSLQSVSSGVQRVNAQAVWALGVTGQGIVLADLDTGVQWDHPALQPHYRGWNGITATHDYNWFDPVGESVSSPTDDQGHGTHTTGTLVGDDGAGTQTGVAPGAQWIACRNMAYGKGSVSRYIACFQFALAPTDVNGNNPNPALAADITSNSWTCWGETPYYEEGCLQADSLLTATQALRSAGVMVIAAAGNQGGGCSSVAQSPGTYQSVLTIGSTQLDAANTIAASSGRGPSAYDGSIKPDVVAPGVGIYSTLPNNTYGSLSGTSMATPHVAGVVALMWSAVPGLRGDIDDTEAILRNTATPLTSGQTCGGVPGSSVPNNTYGYGLVNAQAAVSEALHETLSANVVSLNERLVPFTYTVTLTNFTALTRTDVGLTVTLPASLTLLQVTQPVVQEEDTLSWSFGQLSPHTAVSVTLVVSADMTGAYTLTNYKTSLAMLTGEPVGVFVYAHRVWLAAVLRE
jgi:subtilisin family serine protease